MNLAIIPARGGSKRIERKNIRLFCGRPIIEYSIEAAISTRLFDRIIVSTDCPDITGIAIECGAEVPFVRPDDLANDDTPTVPVVRHAIQWLETQSASGARNQTIDLVCCLYPTAPFVSMKDLIKGRELLVADSSAEFAFPVTTYPYSIFRSLQIEKGRASMIWPEYELTRSQDLPTAWHDAGQFYWGTRNGWMSRDRILSANSIPIVIPRHRVQDIDTIEDWERAERMYQAWQNGLES